MEDININFVTQPLPVSKSPASPKVTRQRPDANRRKQKIKRKQMKAKTKLVALKDKKKDEVREIFSATKFSELPICDKLKASLSENSYTFMTLIQQRAIPTILSNQFVLVKSETGSGKTFAYLIPLLQKLYELSEAEPISRDKGAYAIIFAPTRELAIQIYESCLKLTKRMAFVISGALMGGEAVKKEKARLRKGLNIIIATPGRLLYHLRNTQAMVMSNLRFLVFDEADRILDLGFEKEVKTCIGVIKDNTKDKFGTLSIILAAATTGGKLTDLVKSIMTDYIPVGFEVDTDSAVKVPSTIQQYYSIIPSKYKIHYLLSLLFSKQKSKLIVFFSTCQEVNYVYELIRKIDWNELGGEKRKHEEALSIFNKGIYKLHGNMQHSDRKVMFSEFNSTKTGVLVSTDIIARGLDFQGVRWIIHYDINNEIKEYVNRIGRTARLNTGGKSLCFLMEEEKGYIKKLKDIGLEFNSIPSEAILDNFTHAIPKYIKQYKGMNVVGDIGGLIRTTIGKDKTMIQLALGAYKSSISSFAARSIKDKAIFNYKEINFGELAHGFGLAKEWVMENKKKRIMMEGYDKIVQGGKNKLESNKVEDIAEQKIKKMEEVIKKMNKGLANSLDY